MPAANHPAYKEELGRCRYTLDYVAKTLEAALMNKEQLDSKVEGMKKHYNSDNSQNYIDLMINSMMQSSMSLKIRNLVTAKNKPYFARVDFQEEGKKNTEKLYIGKMSLMREEDQQVIIVDWRAPIANLYYEERLGEAHYNCPDGDIKGSMLLKRQFSINEGVLNEIFDIDITTNDEFLQAYLGASSENRLKEIVSTIQVEQNMIIRADMWRPIVVQGAAGSGKTTIALHRIAYLIYLHEKKLKPENFMIIAPNKLFLNYISEVLPELGVERVVQSTFEAFASQILGKKFKVKDPNEKLISFIKNSKDEAGLNNDMLYKATRIKASMKFKQVIDRYVEYIENAFIPVQNFEIEGQIIYTYDDINQLFLREYKRLPLVKRIDEIKKHLNSKLKVMRHKIINRLQNDSDSKISYLKQTMENSEERHRLIVEVIDRKNEKIDKIESYSKKAVKEYIKSISKFSPWQYYVKLMGDISLFEELCKGIEDIETSHYLAKYSNDLIKEGFIEIEDFAPLIYLKFMIYGIDEKIDVKQVVIDEAQDFSVFQLYALKKLIKDSSFTILGDLNQGIHSYRGIEDWNDVLTQVFDEKKAEYMTLEQSYRTSIEIMDAANLVIGMLKNEKVFKSKPVFRHGEPICLVKNESDKDLIDSVYNLTKNIMSKGFKSLAIIAKTIDECQKFHKKIKSKLPEISLITGKEDAYKGGIVVVPSYLSKGLEFDAVIIINAGEFSDTDLDIKLMYVAMTRALHELYISYNDIGLVVEELKKHYLNVGWGEING